MYKMLMKISLSRKLITNNHVPDIVISSKIYMVMVVRQNPQIRWSSESIIRVNKRYPSTPYRYGGVSRDLELPLHGPRPRDISTSAFPASTSSAQISFAAHIFKP